MQSSGNLDGIIRHRHWTMECTHKPSSKVRLNQPPHGVLAASPTGQDNLPVGSRSQYMDEKQVHILTERPQYMEPRYVHIWIVSKPIYTTLHLPYMNHATSIYRPRRRLERIVIAGTKPFNGRPPCYITRAPHRHMDGGFLPLISRLSRSGTVEYGNISASGARRRC